VRAAEKGRVEEVLQLIAAGADVNATRGVHGSALMNAAGNGHASVVRSLLENGAEVDLVITEGDVSATGGTALQWATSRRTFMVLGKLKNGETESQIENRGLLSSNAEVVRLLLEAGADPNPVALMMSPLHSAVAHENVDLVRLLLDFGANVNARSLHGKTPLEDAVSARRAGGGRRTEVVDLLRRAGAR
jgi:ankyrin repeat protein